MWYRGSFILLFLLQSCWVFAQQISFENKLSEFHSTNSKPPNWKTRQWNRYAEDVVYSKCKLFRENQIIRNAKVEAYFKGVIESLVSPESNYSQLEVYLVKDDSYNAFTLYDGSIYLNIGLVADIKDEASLALVIAHELGHFINSDIEKSYKERLKIKKTRKEAKQLTISIDHAHKNRLCELSADSIAFDLCFNAGYNMNNAIDNFYLLGEDELLAKKRLGKSRIEKPTVLVEYGYKPLNELLASHPELDYRVEKLSSYFQDDNHTKGNHFLVSQKKFEGIQNLCRLLKLKYLMENLDFEGCLEQAFIYHLQDSRNGIYINYALESIRKITYIESTKNNQGFLTNKILDKNFPKSEGILHDIEFLVQDKGKLQLIKKGGVLGSVKFKTYAEAFQYFKKVALQIGCKECELPISLYESDTARLINYSQKGKLKAFAEDYVSGNIETNSFSKNNIIIEDIKFYDVYGYGKRLNYKETQKKTKRFIEFLQQKNTDQEFTYRDQSSKGIDTLIQLVKAGSLIQNDASFVNSYYSEETEKYREFIELFPEYWSFIKENEIKKVTYIDANEDKKFQYLVANLPITLIISIGIPPAILKLVFSSPWKNYSVSSYSFDFVNNKFNYQYRVNDNNLTKRVYYRKVNRSH